MNPSNSLSNSLLFYSLLIIFVALKSHGIDNSYSDCQPFDCGKMKTISYPFRQNKQPASCGHPGFVLDCPESDSDYPLLQVTSQKYLVLDIDPNTQILKLARADLLETTCPENPTSTNFESTPFNYTPKDYDMSLLYDCDQVDPQLPPGVNSFSCAINNVSRLAYFAPAVYGIGSLWHCKVSVLVPVTKEAMVGGYLSKNELNVSKVLEGGFEVQWTDMDRIKCKDCLDSKGHCGFDVTINQFICLCNDSMAYERKCVNVTQLSVPSQPNHKNPPGRDHGLKAKIGISAGVGGIVLMCVVFFLYQWYKKKRYSAVLSRNISSDMSSAKDVEKAGSTYLGVPVFTYEELIESTNNFDSSKELGDGGFGTVYKGKLKDGRVVAVKRLYENNFKRVEQFMNEIKILEQVRHHNLVSLYGCTSSNCRELLLVYEFVPNGTVSDHLHGNRSKPDGLPWPTRLSIAIETACALSYLHHKDIIHRDVKTNNILLDKNFTVKVADFGLSRLFPTQATHVSTAPQGTPGYVDPDYHQCYQLTSKSDVFSFGVVLMELVTAKTAVDITRHRHDINLSTMAINRIQNCTLHEIVDPTLRFGVDPAATKMITAVAELAFQCLQSDKDMRPSMEDVWEELKAIESRDYGPEKMEKVVTSADDAVLLENGVLSVSPESVSVSWSSSSRNTTPNASN